MFKRFFLSSRERRLWLMVLAVIIGIYATLRFASTLVDLLYNDTFGAAGFATAMLLVAIAILTQGLKTRPKGIEIGVWLGLFVVYYLLFFRLTIPERSHLIEYSIVAILIFEALDERVSQGGWVPVPAILAIILTSLIGTVDELIQLFLPNRVFDLTDILFNFLAALTTVIILVLLGWVRQSWN